MSRPRTRSVWYDRHFTMHDAGYKRLFAQPHTVQDLLRGFAARDWSEALDFSTLTPVPASFVSHRLRQRHGDLVWKVRFRDEWLYLLVLLVPLKLKGTALESLPGMEEVGPMLQDLVAGWVAEGREQGIEQGRSEERRLLCRQAALKFTPETAPRLSVLLERLTDPESLLQVGDWIIECATEEELLARVQDAIP